MRKLLILCGLILASCQPPDSNSHSEKTAQKPVLSASNTNQGLNRTPHIRYSKHAQCRMDCRHIDETEIKAILQEGTINYKKSDLNQDDCHKRYAVEGYSKDGQRLRIIVAYCNTEATIITCIDLNQEWECHCS